MEDLSLPDGFKASNVSWQDGSDADVSCIITKCRHSRCQAESHCCYSSMTTRLSLLLRKTKERQLCTLLILWST